MRALVTGTAGFIGSRLAEELLRRGDDVLGIDALTSYYDLGQKREALDRLLAYENFTSVQVDLRTAPLDEFAHGCDVVFHQAAQPGVRASWGAFASYVEHNVLVTQRVLEAARAADVQRLVYASSSSVYGNSPEYPTREDQLPRPHSPYGVTKLAGEQLVRLYGENWGLSTVSLRYFTVYGPGQRPDMAMHRLLEGVLRGQSFSLYGDGTAIRDFTFVDDVVAANLLAAEVPLSPGTVVNVAGGGSISMRDLLSLVKTVTGLPVRVQAREAQAGDVAITGGDITAAHQILGWTPTVGVQDGLTKQFAWHEARHRSRLANQGL